MSAPFSTIMRLEDLQIFESSGHGSCRHNSECTRHARVIATGVTKGGISFPFVYCLEHAIETGIIKGEHHGS